MDLILGVFRNAVWKKSSNVTSGDYEQSQNKANDKFIKCRSEKNIRKCIAVSPRGRQYEMDPGDKEFKEDNLSCACKVKTILSI